jgi:predicted  nucleic acid-binding Zn-ribbon protein
VRLTIRRLEHSIPQSMAEIQADKDALRAEFAMSMRGLEITVDELKNKHSNALAELGRKDNAINRLKIERDAQKVEFVALKAEVATLKDHLTAAGKEIGAIKLSVMQTISSPLPRRAGPQAKSC